jgi:Fe-Mn family superoxide dismutase
MTEPTDASRRNFLFTTLPALGVLGALGTTTLAQDAGDAQVDWHGGSAIGKAVANAFKDGKYALPPLPYAADALEPHIDAATMELHHGKHHQAYVNNLNKTLATLAELRQAGGEPDAARLSGLQRDLSFNAGGHVLHTVFWATMAPNAGGTPTGPLADAIAKQFGSFDAFKGYYSSVALGVKGSGWAILWYEPIGDSLVVSESGDQDLRMVPGAAPLLPLDVWEHAYYLKYQNRRAAYVSAWWNVVNWSAVNEAYEALRGMYRRGG